MICPQWSHYKGKRQKTFGEEEKTRDATKTVVRTRVKGCGGHDLVSLDRTSLRVPSCPPSGLQGCQIMKVEYYIKVNFFSGLVMLQTRESVVQQLKNRRCVDLLRYLASPKICSPCL